ncbi:acyl-CoA dehydrogenase family protein [Pendulispora albinea]|uniref:Acyl-CoA dehydrogenase n=1 Tax=Pendulispora albinea TaxID=2741071 RepID=A0ABZ2LS12_9BACT
MKPSTFDLTPFFSPEHTALGQRCYADFVERDAPALHTPGEVIPYLGKTGYLAHLAPPAGRAVSVRSLCIVRESLGYRSPLADSIFAVQGLGSYPLVLTPGFAGRERILDDVVSGARVAAFALTEPEAGSDVASMRSTARKDDGGGWRLDGEKVFISNVGIARHYVVFANADPAGSKKGISAFLVDAGARGLELAQVPMSVDHPLGRLVMRDCRVPEGALIGEVGHGMRLALGTLGVFRTSVGAAAVGMASRALDETLAHVRTRRQFGQRLADFQLTQAALAEMATELDAARLLVIRAAWLKDETQGARAGDTAVAMAKMFATEAAQRIIDRAVQLHGGLGVVLGSVVERLYREIRALRIYEGTTEIQKLIIGSSLAKASEGS